VAEAVVCGHFVDYANAASLSWLMLCDWVFSKLFPPKNVFSIKIFIAYSKPSAMPASDSPI
jgi:hypothetical protein